MNGSRACGLLVAMASSMTALLGAVAPARACSPDPCYQGGFSLASGATIPANTRALLWTKARNAGQDAQPDALLAFSRVDDGSGESVPFEVEPLGRGDVLVSLNAKLVVGGRYRLAVETEAGAETGTDTRTDTAPACTTEAIEFEAGAEAELPQRLGTAKLSMPKREEVTVTTYSGSCDTQLPAVSAKLELELAREAKPWGALLRYTTLVDDDVWAPNWSLGPYGPQYENAEDLLFAECPGELASGRPIDKAAVHDGLKQGGHRVRIEAVLPGVDGVLATDDAPLELDCGASDSCSIATPGRSSHSSYPFALAAAGVAALILRLRKHRRR